VPLGVAAGTGCVTAIAVLLIASQGLKRRPMSPTLAALVSTKQEPEAQEEVHGLLKDPEDLADIAPVPPVDQILKSMETENHRRRLEDLLRRWVDVAHRYSEAALVLRKEIHAVVQHTEQAANTISSSFQAVINKATLQAREAMELLEGTQAGA